MGPLIQRFPTALLPTLGIKATETPSNIGNEVQASLEMAAFYMSDRLEVQTAQSLAVTTVQFTYLQVPQGETWWLHSISAAANNCTVGSTIVLTVGIADQSSTNSYLNTMSTPRVTTSAAETVILTGQPSLPILLRSGMKVFMGTAFPPTSADLYLRALIARLTSLA